MTDPDEVVGRVLRMVREGVVEAVTGETLAVDPDSICLHSDTQGAVELAAAAPALTAPASSCWPSRREGHLPADGRDRVARSCGDLDTVRRLDAALLAADLPWVQDIVPAYDSVLVIAGRQGSELDRWPASCRAGRWPIVRRSGAHVTMRSGTTGRIWTTSAG